VTLACNSSGCVGLMSSGVECGASSSGADVRVQCHPLARSRCGA
jgi:hypothetical protein